MNPFINSILLTLLSCFVANSQVEEIELICTKYDSLLDQSNAEEHPNAIPSIKITSSLTKRAIGPVDHDITIYFDEYELLNRADAFPPDKKATIRKVIFNINAGSYAIRYQYYFNPKGHLIKYKEIEVGYECIVRSLFFNKGDVVKHTLKPTNKGCLPEDQVKGFERNKMTEKDIELGHQIKKEAKKFEQLLHLHYALICD